MLLDRTQIRRYVEANPDKVTRRESVRYPGLFVLKYKHSVFYDAAWTPELEGMRGTVVDADYNVVIRPFQKIYNFNENEATIPLDEDVIAVNKVNGFMAAVTFVPEHGVVVSTTGSLDSPFVDLAKEHMKEGLYNWVLCQREHTTYLFEVVDQDKDPHIITESHGLHVIGARNVHTGVMASEDELDQITQDIGAHQVVRRPVWTQTKFSRVLEWAKHSQHEGYVVHGKTTTLKIKTPFYLTAKFLARVRQDKLDHALVNRARTDEEFYPLLDKIQKEVEYFKALDEQQRLQYIRDFYYG